MHDLKALRAFVAVAHEGSVSRAAEALHLTQPAVSLKLKQLQETLGLTLFKRHAQGLALTTDGQNLLKPAETALAALKAFDIRAQSMHDTLRGRLRIGTIVDPEFIRLGALLHQLVQRIPQVETDLHHGTSGLVLDSLLHRELDVGFYLESPGQQPETVEGAPEVEMIELTYFAYNIIAPEGWSSSLVRTDWPSLAALPWIVTPRRSVHYRLLAKQLLPLGLTPNRVAQVDQEPCMIDLVRAGVGLALARDANALQERQERGLIVAKGISLPCALSFIWLKERRDEPVIAAVRDALADIWSL
ncbi:LysR family transcriptional regulator [Vreelandella venusta]|uniref:LysR family transcriptional regulator n=2 Tax=Halomonadaceae TaxID=28256 RepID=A0AAP9ZBK1_9GAMM|nr:LysR family transcriptional regulator [Halomonas venusta]ACV84071.1 DddZ [Halomonas sp. HTNK1]AZM96955.1 LysR family transcriptional regulator [Halomonas venusta]MDW0359529.1 LysR family transcriptional regulator [Halomonas venusta]NPT31996.1 LysR family transcriptional regulator [Halomonas venusta]QRL02421.1 LysR family transcriptional regulator [Halomonas venusta]